jgi:beta-glucanase (GH16 family)
MWTSILTRRTNFNVWGFDILPDRVVWHVNGKVIHTWLYTDEHYVDPAYEMLFNSWTRDMSGSRDHPGKRPTT